MCKTKAMYTHTSIAINCAVDGLGYEFQQVQQIFPSPKPSRPVLRPSFPPFQRVPRISSIKWPVREADQSSPSSADVQINGAIPPLHLRFHGVDRDKFTVYTYTNVSISTAVCTKYILLYTSLFSERNCNAIRIISKSGS